MMKPITAAELDGLIQTAQTPIVLEFGADW